MSKPLGLAVLLALSSLATAQCIQGSGSTVTLLQDSISGPNAIGFAFPLFGSTYTDIHISDHGLCFFSNGGTPAVPVASPLVYTPVPQSLVANGPIVCPFWSDTIPGYTGSFHVDAQPTQCTVTWLDVQSFGFPQPLMSFQLKLYPNGSLEFLYNTTVTNNSTYQMPSDNAVIGVSPGAPAVLPVSSDLSAGVVTTDDTVFELIAVANAFDMGGDSLLLTPTNPGWTVTYDHNGAGCADVEAYGAGCDGLVLTSNAPVLGTTWTLVTTGLNPVSQVGFTLFAFGRANPSELLSNYGLNAPGCWSHLPATTVVTRLVGTNSGGTMAVSVSMPAVAPWLIGESFTNQTFAFTDQNLAGIASSNGLHCTMGN